MSKSPASLRSHHRPLGLVAAVGLLSLTACGGSSATPDAGTHDAAAAGDAGAAVCSGPVTRTDLTATTTGEDGSGTPDYTCLGTTTAPVGGDPVATSFRLAVFGQDGQYARNTRVWFFADNVITDTCGDGCEEVMSGDDGVATTSVHPHASGWYAYRVFQNLSGGTDATRYTDSVQYNEPAPATAGQSVDGNAVALSTIQIIPLSLGLSREPGTTILSGRVQDCAGNDVGGAIVRVFDPSGNEILEADEALAEGTHYRYFRRLGDESRPSNEQPSTNYEGLYAVINVAQSENLYRVEAWGVDGSGDPQLLGCEAIRTLADGVSIVNVGPLRSDYSADHPCACHND